MSVFMIREAQQVDIPGMAKVNLDIWRSAYRGILPGDFLASLSYETTVAGWQAAFARLRTTEEAVFVAENEAQQIVSLASCGPEQSQDPVYQGEIHNLYVLPDCQRQGVGRRLVAACVGRLIRQIQAQTLLVWVMVENPYRAFYESLGGKVVREKTVQVGGMVVQDVGYGWEDLPPLQLLTKKQVP